MISKYQFVFMSHGVRHQIASDDCTGSPAEHDS